MRAAYQDVTDHFYWVALPLTTVNGVSQLCPEWVCWQPSVEWVRMPPGDAITEETSFPFYTWAMTFEDFVPAFSRWFAAQHWRTAVLTGSGTMSPCSASARWRPAASAAGPRTGHGPRPPRTGITTS